MSDHIKSIGTYNPEFAMQQMNTLYNEASHLRATLAERDAEIAALKAEREWRPIESAPRDGTRVLVYAPPPDPAKWHGSTLGSLICTVEYHADGGWCVCEIREATRWQPLPPAPEAT